jgi:D-glycero-D-manno-heptose 1,7-bisphosphate phosphatase
VAKRVMTAQAARAVQAEVVRRFLASGAELFASHICPHTPIDGCPCRKPQPGMILYASERLNIDLSRSYLVGDALSDIAAGEAAGVRSHLVLTGCGAEQAGSANAGRLSPRQIHPNLWAVAETIVQLDGAGPPVTGPGRSRDEGLG